MTPELRERARASVQVITRDGKRLAAGRASLFVLAEIGWNRRLVRLLQWRPLIWAVELGYRIVARNRRLFGRLLFRRAGSGDGSD